MANRKKKDEALAAVQAQTEGSGQPAVQSGYSAAGLENRSEVENWQIPATSPARP